jgi:hypothetical protein
VEPGSHTLHIEIDWAGSNEVTVTATEGALVELECAPGGSALAGLWRTFFAPQRYIELRRVSRPE